MLKHIVVPTDFSDCANSAVDIAIPLAAKVGAELHFLHAIDSSVDWVKMPMMTSADAAMSSGQKEDLYPEMKERLGQARHQLDMLLSKATTAGVEATIDIAYNQASKHITDYAANKQADLIVLGSHGASGFREAFIGSNAQRVVRNAHCPVLTVKGEVADFQLGHLLYASDFNEDNVNTNLTQVRDFAALFGAKIHLLFVNTPTYFEETDHSIRKMERLAEVHELSNFEVSTYSHYTTEDGVLAVARKLGVDAIGMTVHGFKGMRRIVSNNVTETLVNHSEIPVLSFNLK